MDFNIHRNFWHMKQISRTRFTSRCRSEVFRVSPFILTSDKGKPKVPLDREAILLSYWGFLESAVRSHRNSSHSFWVGRRIEWITYCYREWVVESGSHTVVQSWVENWWTLVGRSLFKQARKKQTNKQTNTNTRYTCKLQNLLDDWSHEWMDSFQRLCGFQWPKEFNSLTSCQ